MARIGVISDPHGNAEALTAVLRQLDQSRIDRLLCVGDLVGYNADPNGVVRQLAASAVCIAGNHDRIAIGALDKSHCWYGARTALDRTEGIIDDATRAFLAGLPTVRQVDGGLFMFHGCIDDVGRYCRSERDLLHNDRLASERHPRAWLGFFGHTHVPGVHAVKDDGHGRYVEALGKAGRIELDYGSRFFVNPGSVDGARREAPIAQFAILDTIERVVDLCQVGYDHRASEHKARRAGYRPNWPNRVKGELRSMVRASMSLIRR